MEVTFERRALGATNSGGVERNERGAVAWKERTQDGVRRRVERKSCNIGVVGDIVIVRRLGCMMKRFDGIYTSADQSFLDVWGSVFVF